MTYLTYPLNIYLHLFACDSALLFHRGRVWFRAYILMDETTEKPENLHHPKILFRRENTSALFHNIINSQAKQMIRFKRYIQDDADGQTSHLHPVSKRSTHHQVVRITDVSDVVSGRRDYNWWLDTHSGGASIGFLCLIAICLVVLLLILVINNTYIKPRRQ